MAEPKPEGAVPEVEKQTPKQPEPAKDESIDIEAIRAENERLKKENELKDNDLKGKDRKLTEFQKALNATKTEEERKQAEAEERRKAGIVRYSRLAVKAVGLNEDFSELITGNDEEEIDSKIDTFQKIKASIEEPHLKTIKTLQAEKIALEEEIKILKASGAVPKRGEGADEKTITRTEFNTMSELNKVAFFKTGGKIIDD